MVYRVDKGMLEHHYFVLWCANSGIKDTVEGGRKKKNNTEIQVQRLNNTFVSTI